MLTWIASLTWNPTWTAIHTWSPAWTEMLTWSPAILTVSVVKKRCISRSAKQKMQLAVASIHQLQEISCCKQESRPVVEQLESNESTNEQKLLADSVTEAVGRYCYGSCWQILVQNLKTATIDQLLVQQRENISAVVQSEEEANS
ncbi:F-box protein [Dorcoceras hygrometricum]|uniref:F-box protein n=1 Tax=Dorcoceras hygrometricum TaxID=472368 RepID=A0A2Z7ATB7_9LAMI|nr:F-box protein [Dorcoceras hygrometricum]